MQASVLAVPVDLMHLQALGNVVIGFEAEEEGEIPAWIQNLTEAEVEAYSVVLSGGSSKHPPKLGPPNLVSDDAL